MKAWLPLYTNIVEAIEGLGGDVLLYRGHCDSSWPLMPGLGRLGLDTKRAAELEKVAYFDFLTRAGDLLPANNDSWSNVFSMQHYGMPTRLLDWSETFGVALYFALKDGVGDAAVWILDPFALNKTTLNRPEIIHPTDLNSNYSEYFLEETRKLEGDVVAISPLRHNPRVFHQRAGFTLHDDLETPLEELHSGALRKFIIPADTREEWARFLKLSGISEFTLFPDLDGLARELKAEIFGPGTPKQPQPKKRTVGTPKRKRKEAPNPITQPDANRVPRDRRR